MSWNVSNILKREENLSAKIFSAKDHIEDTFVEVCRYTKHMQN